ncbi:hypothetical protein ABXV20_25470 [Bacillus paranthracis]|nr:MULTISPECIES: hypothetical protein [Bacillus]MDA1569973.1 hypothetical protein [Bacillus cereus]MED1611737.1 hypothetical protein [Bacillus paranthracis]MED1650992.1 hypothetical protein [Bacillus pacificus]HDR7927447.1 hypothetical protein [Bacillus paranthracis]
MAHSKVGAKHTQHHTVHSAVHSAVHRYSTQARSKQTRIAQATYNT